MSAPATPALKPLGKGDVPTMIKAVLRPGMTAVDVGAATGDMTRIMWKCVGPTGRVIAIEPRDTEIKGDPDDIHRVACGVVTRSVRSLYIPQKSVLGTNATFWRENLPPRGEPATTIEVPVEHLDNLVPAADLVKIDVQGAEVDVLAGAERLLETCPNWIIEVWPEGLKAASFTWITLWKMVKGFDLTPYDTDGVAITWDRMQAWDARRTRPTKHLNWLCRRS